MSVGGALAGGFAGTLVLTTILRAASEMRLTRIDLPFLLGTAFTANRLRAKALGYALHFLAGFVFALVYYAIFVAIDRSGWWLGASFGLVHALFAARTHRRRAWFRSPGSKSCRQTVRRSASRWSHRRP
jgi:hypothetical protein